MYAVEFFLKPLVDSFLKNNTYYENEYNNAVNLRNNSSGPTACLTE